MDRVCTEDVNVNFSDEEKLLKEIIQRDAREGELTICQRCKSPYLLHTRYTNPDFCICCSTDRLSIVNKGVYREMTKQYCRTVRKYKIKGDI